MLVRKIDLYLQLAIALLSLFSMLFTGITGLLLGMLALGGWQLLSALLNTLLTRNRQFVKRMRIYWLGTCLVIGALLLMPAAENYISIPDGLVMLLLVTGVLACIGLAAFYWYCCKELISELNFDKGFRHIVRRQIIS